MKINHFNATFIALAAALTLTACGGGGGEDSGDLPNPPVNPPVNPGTTGNELKVFCAADNCGAVDSNVYSGSGVGVWEHENTTNATKTINVNLRGVQGKTIYASLVNLTPAAVNISNSNMNTFLETQELQNQQMLKKVSQENSQQTGQTTEQFHAVMNDFNNSSMSNLQLATNEQNAQKASFKIEYEPNFVSINDIKSFSFYNSLTNSYANQNFRFVKGTSAPDGRVLQYWVQDSEWNPSKVISSDIDFLNTKFLKTYSENIRLNGQPYGTMAERYNNLIPSFEQPINILVGNISPNNRGYGVVGYYFSQNNFRKSSYPSSNEALQVFLDSESIYTPEGVSLQEGSNGRKVGLELTSTSLIHEFSHMIAYYERNLGKNLNDGTIASESMALSTEFVLQELAEFQTDIFARRGWPFFLSADTNKCGIFTWNECSNSYERTSTLMAFLNTKYGEVFHKDLVKEVSPDMYSMVNKTVTTLGGNMKEDMKKFAILPAGLEVDMPAGFGIPGSNGNNLKMKNYNGALTGSSSSMTNPTTLTDYGSIFFVKSVISGNEVQKSIVVPAGTALVVMVK